MWAGELLWCFFNQTQFILNCICGPAGLKMVYSEYTQQS